MLLYCRHRFSHRVPFCSLKVRVRVGQRGLTQDQAYYVQERLIDLGEGVTGAHIGWKVGATAPGPQKALGLPGPFRAPLFAKQVCGPADPITCESARELLCCRAGLPSALAVLAAALSAAAWLTAAARVREHSLSCAGMGGVGITGARICHHLMHMPELVAGGTIATCVQWRRSLGGCFARSCLHWLRAKSTCGCLSVPGRLPLYPWPSSSGSAAPAACAA
eukprot:COSAG01_NODE_4946_length_4600_cov_9.134192_7_plen_221_part_00